MYFIVTTGVAVVAYR